jgi:hypothetical protein
MKIERDETSLAPEVRAGLELVRQQSKQQQDPWAVQLAREEVYLVGPIATDAALDGIRGLQVTNDDEEAFAAQLLREIKETHHQLDEKRETITKPLHQAHKAANGFFKPALKLLEEEEKVLKEKLGRYHLHKEAAYNAAVHLVSAAETPQQAEQAMELVSNVEAPQGMSFRMVSKFAVDYPELVPREYCSPDPQKIAAALGAGVEVPGVRVYQEQQVIARRS